MCDDGSFTDTEMEWGSSIETNQNFTAPAECYLGIQESQRLARAGVVYAMGIS